MNRSNLVIRAVLFLLVLSSLPAAAYVDPGTAAVLFQAGYAIFYGILAGLAFFFRPIKRMFLTLKAKITGRSDRDQVTGDT